MRNPSQILGQSGERLAEKFLKRQGYRIQARNYRCKAGELDLVAMKDETLVIVEVKTRSSLEFGSPAEAVTFRKQKQICQATQYYMQQHQLHESNIRFDVIAILAIKNKKPAIEHISNAFDFCL